MRVYFLSEIPCALTVGGAYLGLVNGFERSAEVSGAPYCEFRPLGDYLPFGFFLDEDFLLSPPRGAKIYYTKDAAAIYACGFLRADQSLKILFQKRTSHALLTLVRQGDLKLFLDGDNANILPLEEYLEDSHAEEIDSGFLLEGKRGFALISFEGKLLVSSEGKVLSREKTLKAEIPFHDALRHFALCEWEGEKLVGCTIRTEREPTEATFALALFESALIGADCTPFLSERLRPKANSLRSYLGDFCSVVLTDERNVIGLVYERKERVFDVKYFRVELSEGKISNLMPAE